MPKGKAPSMTSVSNGPISSVIATNKSKCSRCDAVIAGGGKCAEMKVSKAGFTKPRRFCIPCAQSVIDCTRAELDRMAQQFE